MQPVKLKAFLSRAIPAGRSVLVKGQPGIGKSAIVRDVAAELGAEFIVRHPGIEEPVDSKGMPALSADGKSAHFLPFGDLEKLITASKLTVCCLEDLGWATPATQGAVAHLIWDRRVNGTLISPHVVFLATTNDTGQMAGVSGLIEPLKSRWHTILELTVSVDDFSQWWLDKGLPVEPLAFVRAFPQLLNDFKPTRELTNSPCPRTWEAVGHALADGTGEFEIFAGQIGEGAAIQFSAWVEMSRHLPSIDDILLNPKTADLPPKTISVTCVDGKERTFSGASIGIAVATALARRATAQNFERVTAYSGRLDKMLDVLTVKDAVRQHKGITSSAAFVAWSVRNAEVLL